MAGRLRDAVEYLIILNELEQPDEPFRYWYESKQAKDFAQMASPKVIRMASRRPDLEGMNKAEMNVAVCLHRRAI